VRFTCDKRGRPCWTNLKIRLAGNVVDLAIGIIVGAAFGAIVSSLVADIIMPVVGAVTGGLEFPTISCRYRRKLRPTA
jgi:large conductance mechanosensitive channel protein